MTIGQEHSEICFDRQRSLWDENTTHRELSTLSACWCEEKQTCQSCNILPDCEWKGKKIGFKEATSWLGLPFPKDDVQQCACTECEDWVDSHPRNEWWINTLPRCPRTVMKATDPNSGEQYLKPDYNVGITPVQGDCRLGVNCATDTVHKKALGCLQYFTHPHNGGFVHDPLSINLLDKDGYILNRGLGYSGFIATEPQACCYGKDIKLLPSYEVLHTKVATFHLHAVKYQGSVSFNKS